MLSHLKTRARRALEIAVAFTPWVVSAYVLYWLESAEIWTTETAHRGKISVAILATGLVLSFLMQSYLSNRKK